MEQTQFDLTEKSEGCRCQGCNSTYQVDIMVPDALWEKIKPKDKPVGAGLLCGGCIMDRLEAISGYGCWTLSEK